MLLVAFHCIFSILTIILVLIQKEKGAGMMSMGGASQTLFGSQGSGSFVTRLTVVVGFCFFATCLGLGLFYNKSRTDDVMALLSKSDAPVVEPVKPVESSSK